MTTASASYEMSDPQFPFSLEVDPPAPQNRLSVLLRVLYAIPQLIAVYLIGIGAAVVAIIAWFSIVITGKYPAGMLNFATGATRWNIRALGYLYLLTDKYPPFSLDSTSSYPVRFEGTGTSDGRNRVTVFFRLFMIIPHAIIVGALGYVVAAVAVIGWFVALFTGSVPGGLHKFIAGYVRWLARYTAYAMLLTDEYPPFALG